MGYSTDFEGKIEFSKPLTDEQVNVLNKFFDDDHDPDMLGLYTRYCDLVADNYSLRWNGSEKSYGLNVENGWFPYLIEHFFKPWGIELNGTLEWFGEERDDIGQIHIKENVVVLRKARIIYK